MKSNLLRYSVQIAMLKTLLLRGLISEKEYETVKNKLMKDYNIISDLTSWLCSFIVLSYTYIKEHFFLKGR